MGKEGSARALLKFSSKKKLVLSLMVSQEYSCFLQTDICNLSQQKVLDLFKELAISHGFTLDDLGEGLFRIKTIVGDIDLAQVDERTELRISSARPQELYYLKESLDEDLPGFGFEPIWRGNLPLTQRPPTFSVAQVVSTEQINDVFMRIRVKADDVERFFKDHMHFRVIYPKVTGTTPVWPYMNEARRTIWPSGDQELLKPIYTIRQIDEVNRTFDFDVYLHDDGPTAEWSKRVQSGEECGLIGPAGGWMPVADKMLFAGDETAIPAIARILENLPASTAGHVFISHAHPNARVDLKLPAHMTLEWSQRPDENYDALLHSAKVAWEETPDYDFIWFATHKNTVRKARQYFIGEHGFTNDNSYIVGFWV